MPKVFITGAGGAGKSTIINNLKRRGFTAYDTDDVPGATRLENSSGQPQEWPKGYVDWQVYRWNWQRPVIEKLLASGKTVFLGGIPSNWREFTGSFDIIVALTVDPKTHEHRLRTRKVHTHGQGERNISNNVKHQARMLEGFKKAGAVVVTNSQSVDEVVNEILGVVVASERELKAENSMQ